MSRATAKVRGDELEARIIDTDPALEDVSDAEAMWHDARTVAPLTNTSERRVLGRLAVLSGTPVEIKTCALWVGNGASGDRRGRWYLKRETHDRLAAAGGWYYLAVTDDDRKVVRSVVLPAPMLAEFVGAWTATNRVEGPAGRLSWSRVLSPAEVEA